MAENSASAYMLRTSGLSVSFFGHAVVRNVDLTVPRGGIAVLIGRSGSGKTTLLRAINRLNEELPGCRTTGEVELFLPSGIVRLYSEKDGVGISLFHLRRRVAMVFQTPQVFPSSVFRNVSLPLSLAMDCPRSEREDRVRDALIRVDLWKEVENRLDMSAERLSGGQQQRLCLARALALEPEMLLLDEPTASLDVRAARHVEDLLLSLAERLPIIMVSHSLGQSLRLASFLAVLEAGGIRRCIESVDGITEGDLESILAEPLAQVSSCRMSLLRL